MRENCIRDFTVYKGSTHFQSDVRYSSKRALMTIKDTQQIYDVNRKATAYAENRKTRNLKVVHDVIQWVHLSTNVDTLIKNRSTMYWVPHSSNRVG